MTRLDVLARFVVSNGIIQSEGTFVGEQPYVPYFYAKVRKGFGVKLEWPFEPPTFLIEITRQHRADWPEIGPATVAVLIEESEDGSVICTTLSQGEREAFMEERAQAWELVS